MVQLGEEEAEMSQQTVRKMSKAAKKGVSGGGKDVQATLERERLEARLREELEWLKEVSGMGFELKVTVKPDASSVYAGEVKGDTIIVYDVEEEEALETLLHEFLEYCLSQAIAPYRDFTNWVIKMVNEDSYKRKERVVKALAKILKAYSQRKASTDKV
jgi:hypothetical protein